MSVSQSEEFPDFIPSYATVKVEQPLKGRTDEYTVCYGDHLRVWFEGDELHVEHISPK